ncbi:MAG: IS630 family transposase [Desulfoprunum sp.]|uniref:IS630 family transposase n=1 Tax=Desulfoprunum sp. TaxID=2020866 RepID=UPI003C72113B
MAPRYRVTLTKEERHELEAISTKGKRAARTVLYSRALLLLDAGEYGPKWLVERVAEALGITSRSLEHLKKRFVEQGLSAAIERKERQTPPREIQFGGDFEAKLLALACSQAPEGRSRWTVRLLAEKMVELNIVPSVSPMTVCNNFKKNELKPHQSKYWKIPPDQNASFIAAMEDVLEVYARSYDPRFPVVCMDESSMQLIGEVQQPIPAAPGHPVLMDDEYVRNGVANIFMEVEPLGGKRNVKITERRTQVDWAYFIREMLEERYRDAEKVVLIMDNLNTHAISSLYCAFPPEEARDLANRLEIHYTPKHGSWLNIAEIELSVLKRQCLAVRIDCIEKMRAKVTAWNNDRNNRQTKVDWHFKTVDARIKLKRLYPKL